MGKRKVIRLVLDTNVVISALLFGGLPGKLVAQWKNGAIQPLASPPIIDEYLRVLAYPKFKLNKQEIDFLLYNEILPFFEVVDAENDSPLVIVQEDPSDDMFLHCAKAGEAAVIVSGDRHLIELGAYEQIDIVSLRTFFASHTN